MTKSSKFHRAAVLAACFCLLFSISLKGQTSTSGQSTEGTDFWVTLMRADSNNPTELSLTISALQETTVTVENPYTGFSKTFIVTANSIYKLDNLVDNLDKTDCYVGDSENGKVSQRALYVHSDKKISLIAANYRDKSFDVAAILPIASLRDDYRIQCYTPSAHADASQGTHFAIVATEDNTVVDYRPTVSTPDLAAFQTAYANWGEQIWEGHEYDRFRNYPINGTIATDTLKRGEVWYVWTGNGSGESFDLSGTEVTARDHKKIAVFNGNPHTNIPYQVRDRDHIYSQAMPTDYWGTQFAITSSLTTIDGQTQTVERIDKIRIMALQDETKVYIDGQLVYTFDFSTNPKHYYEFDFGAKDSKMEYSTPAGIDYYEGASHYIETSCPCAVHLFMTSDRYDHGKSTNYCNGDPSLLWVNPIEQQISEITFGTFQTAQVKDHFLNIVTEKNNVPSITLDGNSISDNFQELHGNPNYSFARIEIPHGTHTLKANTGFIANVYGFGEKESYAYPAGGATKTLTQTVSINGEIFTPESDNMLCGKDTIIFTCKLNYDYEHITWCFGDGTPNVTNTDSIAHLYKEQGQYNAYVLIERLSTNLCAGQLAIDSIPITVNIAHYTFDFNFQIDGVDVPCKMEGEPFEGKILYTNDSDVKLTELQKDECKIEFDATAQAAGFKAEDLLLTEEYIRLSIPDGAKNNEPYGIIINLNLKIQRQCLDTTIKADTTIYFQLNYDSDILTQRFDHILGLRNDTSFVGDILSDFQWYRTSDSTAIANQQSAVLNRNDFTYNNDDSYYLCFILNKGTEKELSTCTCAKAFKENTEEYNFNGPITISTYTAPVGSRIYINTEGESSFAWYNTSGQLIGSGTLPDKGGSVTIPDKRGLYILHVTTGKTERNFKFSVTD